MFFTSLSEHLLGYISYSFDRFCCSNHAKSEDQRNISMFCGLCFRFSKIWKNVVFYNTEITSAKISFNSKVTFLISVATTFEPSLLDKILLNGQPPCLPLQLEHCMDRRKTRPMLGSWSHHKLKQATTGS